MNSTPPPSTSTDAASFSSDSERSARDDDCAAGSPPAPFRSAPRRSHLGSTRPWHSHSAETTPESQKVRPGGAAAGVWHPVRTADVCVWRPRRDASDSAPRARRLACMLSRTVFAPLPAESTYGEQIFTPRNTSVLRYVVESCGFRKETTGTYRATPVVACRSFKAEYVPNRTRFPPDGEPASRARAAASTAAQHQGQQVGPFQSARSVPDPRAAGPLHAQCRRGRERRAGRGMEASDCKASELGHRPVLGNSGGCGLQVCMSMLFDQNFRRLGQRGRGGGTLGLQQSSLELERRASVLLPLRKPEGPGALETLWVRWLQGEEDQSLQEAVLVCVQFPVQALLETSRRAQELCITRLSALSWRSMIEAAHLVVLSSGTAVFR
jgi:hypothetical protein